MTDTPSNVLNKIEAIAATSSTLAKEQLVAAAWKESPLFQKVVRAAYDPFITYYIAKIPGKTSDASSDTSLLEPAYWEILDNLNARTLSGDNARGQVQWAINALEPASAELFTRILRKDLRASFTDSTINRLFPKTFAQFPYMRCSLPDTSDMPNWDWSKGIIVQEKADGMFANVNVGTDGVSVTSRQGSPIPLENLGGLEKALMCFTPGTQKHGELTVYRNGVILPREVGNGILNSVIQGGTLEEGDIVRFDAWDDIPLSAVVPKGKYNVPYKTRLTGLVQQYVTAAQASPSIRAYVGVIPTRICKVKADAIAYYRELLKQGKEGVICKAPDAIWKDGTSKQQVKFKLEVDVDLEIVNILPGTPGTKTEGRPGSLECRSKCSGLSVNVTVKNEKMRSSLENWPEEWIGKIMVVRSNSIMPPTQPDGLSSLFLPRFVEDFARADKTVADDLEQIKAIFRNAVEG